MASPDSILGLGLIVAGVGFPGGIAILKLWAGKSNGTAKTIDCDTKHKQVKDDVKELFRAELAVVDQKVAALVDSTEDLKGMTQRVLDRLDEPTRRL